jgi:hypothetical protein
MSCRGPSLDHVMSPPSAAGTLERVQSVDKDTAELDKRFRR